MLSYLSLALGLWLATPAQIAPLSPSQQRAANRQSLRDASHTAAPYKDTHLTVTPQQLRRGNTEGPPGVANSPQPAPASRRHLRLPRLHRRPQTEPTP